MRVKSVVMAAVAIGAFFAGGWLLRRGMTTMAGDATTRGAPPAVGPTRLFTAVLEAVRSNAVDSMDESTIYRLATSGVLGELQDPYATIVSAADTTLDRIGAAPVQGVYLDRVEDFVEVVALVPGSPGAAAGIRPGDAVLRVERMPTERQRAEAVAALIDGDSGTSVRVRLGREGHPGPLWVTIERGPVPKLPELSIVTDGAIVRLRLHRIDSAGTSMIRKVVDSVAATGGHGVVIDLRGVVEGTLADAVALADGFLDQGQPIVTVRGRTGTDSVLFRGGGPTASGELPLVLLVDRATAGAAEVVAAALQDHDRAAIVGETTFGRGGHQAFFPLTNGMILRLTTAVWVAPSGRVIQRFPLRSLALGSADSVPPRPKFKTEAGRTVLGGGGVVPDREVGAGVEPSRATDPALELAKRLLSRAKTRRALLAALDAN